MNNSANTSYAIEELKDLYLNNPLISRNDMILLSESTADYFNEVARLAEKDDDAYWHFIGQASALRHISEELLDMNVLEYREHIAKKALEDIDSSMDINYIKNVVKKTLLEMEQYDG